MIKRKVKDFMDKVENMEEVLPGEKGQLIAAAKQLQGTIITTTTV